MITALSYNGNDRGNFIIAPTELAHMENLAVIFVILISQRVRLTA